MALNNTGQVIGLEHYSPYGTVDYQWGSMPTAFNYAGERLDSQTGLLYDTFRYYDPLSGRFVRADNVQDNSTGMDPYAYVGDNPETRNDPSGHCWPLCTMILGAVIGAAISVATTVVSNAVQGKPTSLGEIAQSAVVGAVSGAVSGLAGPEAGPVARMAVGALATGAGQMASNARSGLPLLALLAQAALVGGVTAGVMEGAGALFKGAASEAGDAAEGALSEAEDSAASEAESAGGCALSFGPRTLVATQQGEQVWAYNSQTRKMELEPIEHIWLNHDTDLVDLTLTTTVKDARGKGTQQSEVLHTNEKHPFLTKEQGFLPVSQLKPGMHVREANGRYGTVVKLVVVPGAMWMYNLTVAQDHTYVVGVGQWIVHNCNRAKLRSSTGAGAGQQAHHIIPCACEGDPSVQAAIAGGFQFDGPANGVALFTNPAAAAAAGQVSHSGSHAVYTAFIQSRLNFWAGTGITPLAVVNNTINDGLNYMANLARLAPGIRLF